MILECRRRLKVKGAKLITRLSQKEKKKRKGNLQEVISDMTRITIKKNIRNKQSAYTD